DGEDNDSQGECPYRVHHVALFRAFAQRAAAALLARATLSALVILENLTRPPAPLAARPPWRPRATAWGFFLGATGAILAWPLIAITASGILQRRSPIPL